MFVSSLQSNVIQDNHNNLQLLSPPATHELSNTQVLGMNVPASYQDDNHPKRFFCKCCNCLKEMKGHEENIQAKIWTKISSFIFF